MKISIFDDLVKKCIPAKNNPIIFEMEQKTEEVFVGLYGMFLEWTEPIPTLRLLIKLDYCKNRN